MSDMAYPFRLRVSSPLVAIACGQFALSLMQVSAKDISYIFSAIGVAWSALFADSTREPRMRVSAMKYSQISILLSVNIIALSEKLSHSLEELWVFQLITIAVAIIGCICMYISGSLKLDLPSTKPKKNLENIFVNDNEADNLLIQNIK
uniref:EamA domain-containing protein n=1 Tax=Heterorhabditis bacteriophora TaxID=37862 RepID=A0A1I7XH64_HETBA